MVKLPDFSSRLLGVAVQIHGLGPSFIVQSSVIHRPSDPGFFWMFKDVLRRIRYMYVCIYIYYIILYKVNTYIYILVGLWYNLQQYLQQSVQQNYETRTPSIGYYYYRHPSVN